MPKRNWKRAIPRSLRHSMELCVEYAREKQNLNIDRIADRMGLSSKWTLYKWMENGSMPARLIRTFEHACDCHFMSQYIALSAHKLLIDMPQSKPAKDTDVLALQSGFNDAVNTLAKFYKGDTEADDALAELSRLMTDIASHHARVESMASPELELFGESE